jgi:hypothetical protein
MNVTAVSMLCYIRLSSQANIRLAMQFSRLSDFRHSPILLLNNTKGIDDAQCKNEWLPVAPGRTPTLESCATMAQMQLRSVLGSSVTIRRIMVPSLRSDTRAIVQKPIGYAALFQALIDS